MSAFVPTKAIKYQETLSHEVGGRGWNNTQYCDLGKAILCLIKLCKMSNVTYFINKLYRAVQLLFNKRSSYFIK